MTKPPSPAAMRAAEAITGNFVVTHPIGSSVKNEVVARIIDDAGLREAVEVLTIAQRALCNSVPTVELDGPEPLPLIAALLAKLTA